ncbi:MAG TPA: acyl-CoA dehydrogenase family protein [Mycobacteriales bacterium]|nr:acyl-CoA dehydrogenase family protein [Mycobacteriales bacterium]
MNTALPEDAVAYGEAARGRLERLGGVDFGLRAEADRGLRKDAGAALADLGAGELDVRDDLDQFLAAAQLCRVAGALCVPWPVVEELVRVDGRRVALIDPSGPRVDHGDLDADWLGADLDGAAYQLEIGELPTRAKLGPFLVPARLGGSAGQVSRDDVARHLVLGAWRIIGGLEASLGQVVEHVKARKQFGQALAQFQVVRFGIADASVALRGLDELARFTSWRLQVATPEQRFADAVALRLHAVDTARAVLRTCHQMFGAIGFCDEQDVSVIDRHLQPLLREPCSGESLALRLVPAVRSGEFETLFSS